MNKSETSEDVRRWFVGAIKDLWPVALGSVSLRKSPCIRENYVPDELAPEIQKAIDKGRRLQDLIKEAGVRFLRAEKRKRRSKLQK